MVRLSSFLDDITVDRLKSDIKLSFHLYPSQDPPSAAPSPTWEYRWPLEIPDTKYIMSLIQIHSVKYDLSGGGSHCGRLVGGVSIYPRMENFRYCKYIEFKENNSTGEDLETCLTDDICTTCISEALASSSYREAS